MSRPIVAAGMTIFLPLVIQILSAPVLAEDQSKPTPTHANVHYGPHERNLLDFWQAKRAEPAPLVVFIHGGGFREGSKDRLPSIVLGDFLKAGISVAAINYRFRVHAPLPGAHYDARRAIQFLRSKASDWHIDKNRVAAFGSSAGAQLSMYLAFHDDQAKPQSADPVERESTRLTCVGSINGQTTMDVGWWLKNIPGYQRPHQNFPERFGVAEQAAYLQFVADTSALPLVSTGDPPIYMTYSMAPDAPVPTGEKIQGWQIHHVQFGVALKQAMDAVHLESHLVYPGHPDPTYPSMTEFLIAKLSRQ